MKLYLSQLCSIEIIQMKYSCKKCTILFIVWPIAKLPSKVFFSTTNPYKSKNNSKGEDSNGHDKYGTWHNNWDGREETEEDSSNQTKTNSFRNILLVRHGEYSYSSKELTDLGRLQAKYTGQRLKEMNFKWDDIITSTTQRALETAEIILKELYIDRAELQQCSLLDSGLPIYPIPPSRPKIPGAKVQPIEPRIDEAFRKYFYRASPKQEHDSFMLIIAHNTIIRYFFCCALQFPPAAWSRILLYHGSITWIIIRPTGYVWARHLGDCGFIPINCLSNRKVP